jgi:hypothetical protein
MSQNQQWRLVFRLKMLSALLAFKDLLFNAQ